MIKCCGNVYIPVTFSECNTYQMQILYLNKKIEELEERVKKLEDAQEDTSE